MKASLVLEELPDGKIAGSLAGNPPTGSLLDYLCAELTLAMPEIIERAINAHKAHLKVVKPTTH